MNETDEIWIKQDGEQSWIRATIFIRLFMKLHKNSEREDLHW